MKYLTSGHRRSDITVSPANWKAKNASIKKEWRITYRFYQTGYPPKMVHVRFMNQYKDLQQRQEATEAIIRAIIYDLDDRGYNPNTGVFELDHVFELHERTTLMRALWYAYDRLNYKKQTMIDVKSILHTVEKASKYLVFDIMPVSEIRTKHITLILDRCGQINKKWSGRRHNMYRAYLSKLFTILKKMDATRENPVRDVDLMSVEKKLRNEIDKNLRNKIDKHLRTVNPAFARFIQIFFHSGARVAELMRLQIKDIDIANQRYKVRIEKGRQNKWVWKTIKTIAVPLWVEAMGSAPDEFYLFSKNLVPGEKEIRQDQINRRWRKYVKIGLKLDVELYTLKHMNSTYIAEKLGDEAAAKMNSHTTTGMVINVYDLNRMNRMHQFLKDVDNSFSDN